MFQVLTLVDFSSFPQRFTRLSTVLPFIFADFDLSHNFEEGWSDFEILQELSNITFFCSVWSTYLLPVAKMWRVQSTLCESILEQG